MRSHFLRAYTQLLVKTCHRRGAHAMGGMAAQVPIKDDPTANAAALEEGGAGKRHATVCMQEQVPIKDDPTATAAELEKVRADKRREAGDGHDGTWVAHPGLVAVAREEFEAVMKGENQLGVLREDVRT